MIKWIVRALNYLDKIVAGISGLLLLGVTFVIFINAAGRYTVSMSFLGGQELSRLLTIWLTFLAAYLMVRVEGHVTIDLVLRALPQSFQRVLRGLIGLLGMLTTIYLTVIAWQLVVHSFAAGQTGTTLPLPRALFFVPVLIGSALMTIAFAEKFVRALANRLPKLSSITGEIDEVR